MPLRLPPLAALRIFEAAARLGSFRRAADELNLTPSAVSHGIETLEDWIGAPLFIRKGRSVMLAAAGEDLLPYISQGLSLIAVGAKRVSPRQAAGLVAVSTAATFASHWLVPRLPTFRLQHPDISVAIDTSPRRVMFAVDDFDLAIRMGPGPWPDTDSRLLFREALVPVAAACLIPQMIDANGQIHWDQAVLLHVSTVAHDWASWFDERDLAVEPRSHLTFDTAHLAIEAAVQGLGIALGRRPLCDADIRQGRVIPLAYPELAIETGYWLTLPAGGTPRRAVRILQRWIAHEAGVSIDEIHSSE